MAAVRRGGETPESILVLKPSSFGDIIHTLPAVMLLRRRWPRAQVTWLVNTEWASLLQGSVAADRLVLFPRRELGGLRGIGRFLGWLRGHIAPLRPDVAVDYQGLLRTAIIGRGARPGRFFGLGDAREGARWFYDETAPRLGGVPHAVERYFHLSEMVAGEQRIPGGSLDFPLPAGEQPTAARELAGGYVLLHPFARGEGKSLSINHINQLCEGCQPCPVVLVGRTSEALPPLPSNCHNLLDQTNLAELIWLVRRASFVVSVDSGPAHIAAALDKPMVAIHTWSDPRRVGPYRADAWVCKQGRLLRFEELATFEESFFRPRAVDFLPRNTLEEICRLATSPSSFSA